MQTEEDTKIVATIIWAAQEDEKDEEPLCRHKDWEVPGVYPPWETFSVAIPSNGGKPF